MSISSQGHTGRPSFADAAMRNAAAPRAENNASSLPREFIPALAVPTAPNQIGGSFPPVRRWAEEQWRRYGGSSSIFRYYLDSPARPGDEPLLCECEVRESALPQQFEIEDYEMWADHRNADAATKTPLMVRHNRSPTINSKVDRQQGERKWTMHVCEALGFKRATLAEAVAAGDVWARNRQVDEDRIRRRNPVEHEQDLMRINAQVMAETMMQHQTANASAMAGGIATIVETVLERVLAKFMGEKDAKTAAKETAATVVEAARTEPTGDAKKGR